MSECIAVLRELSSGLDKWMSFAKDAPDSTHNRAVRDAVGVMADVVAITLARTQARHSDKMRGEGEDEQVRI
jgi:hypothetical protein